MSLKAAMEGARAGEAGRGFAVVAQEVKTLAAQTAQATGQIAEQIRSIQAAAREAIAAMSTIRDGISTVHLSTENIRSAMVNHAGTATRISESINETAVLAAATSRTVHDIGGATNNAAKTTGGIDKPFAEVADPDRKSTRLTSNT